MRANVNWVHFVARIGSVEALSPARVWGHTTRTCSRRPSSNMRFSAPAAIFSENCFKERISRAESTRSTIAHVGVEAIPEKEPFSGIRLHRWPLASVYASLVATVC